MPSPRAAVTFVGVGMAMFGCRPAAFLDVSQQNFRVVVERRAAYAKQTVDKHVDFGRFLEAGTVDGVKIRSQTLGRLEVPTGAIVAADPFYLGEDFTRPFRDRVPTGAHPVEAYVADLGPWGQRVAFAVLRIQPKRPSTWRLAETTLGKGGLDGLYGVDAGLGCFADQLAAESMAQSMTLFHSSHPQGNFYNDVLASAFEGHDNWCSFRPSGEPSPNIIIFSSGFGDGLYSTYWGLDPTNQPICLLTDFQVFDFDGAIARR